MNAQHLRRPHTHLLFSFLNPVENTVFRLYDTGTFKKFQAVANNY